MASVIRRRYLGGGVAVLGGLLAAACGEVEVRYVQGPAGPAGPAGTQGERGATGVAGAKGAAGAVGQSQVVVQEKVVTVEKPVVTEKVVTVEAKSKPRQKVVLWSAFWRGQRMVGENSERSTGWVSLANQWNAMDTDVTLALEPRGGGTGTKIVAAYAAGSQPDLMHTAYWSMNGYGLAGMAVELQEAFIKQDKEYAATMDDFYPHLLESSMWQGKVWSLPQETNGDLPYTNLAMVREAGLEPLQLGYTWDDLVEYCKKLQFSVGPGKESGIWAIDGLSGTASQFFNLLKQAGGEAYNKEQNKILFDSPEGIEAVQYVSDLVHKHQVHVPDRDFFEAAGTQYPRFRNGKLAMHYETSAYRLVLWARSIGGLENMYVSPSPTKKDPFIATFGQNMVMFNTTPTRQEAAWQVMRWLTSTEPAAHYAAVTMFLPPRRSVVETAEYSQVLKDVPQFQKFVEALNYAFRPSHPEFPKHYGRITELMSAVRKQPIGVKDAVEQAAREINAMLEQFNQKYG